MIAKRQKTMRITMLCAILLTIASILVACTATDQVPDAKDNGGMELMTDPSTESPHDTIVDNLPPIEVLPDESMPEDAPTVQTWQDAYAEFLRENIPTSKIDRDSLIEGSDEEVRFGEFMAGGYPTVPFFYIYDIDKNGTPELICIDFTQDYCGDVFTFIDNSITKLGSIEFYPFGSLGIPLDKQNGLYSDVGYKGHYGEVLYYTIDNVTIVSQLALEYNNQPDVSPDKTGVSYDFDNFDRLDFYEVTESNILQLILNTIMK